MNEELYKKFLWFIKERESIRKKKEAGHKPPWTDDELLRRYKFTNVWRQDDKVTKDIQAILSNNKNWKDVVLFILWARILNRSESINNMKPAGVDVLQECFQDLDNPPVDIVYGDAFVVLPNLKEGSKKASEMKNLLNIVHSRIIKMSDSIPTSKEVFDYVYGDLCRIKGLIKYEIMCDWWQWSGQPEDYCNIGVGATPSLENLFEEVKVVEEKEVNILLDILKKENITHEIYGELTMRCVEGMLCEFRKYNNLINNPKARKRFYKYGDDSITSIK